MQNVLIIGATSAIAQAVARQFAERGANLVLWARSAEKMGIVASDLRTRYQAKVVIEAFDFVDFSHHAPALDRAIAAHGELHAAILCHGSLGDQAASQADFSVTDQELLTNCRSALSFLTLLANRFEQQGHGTIAVISSVAGDRGRQSNYVYGTAKAALNTFAQGLRNRLYSKGVHVLTVKPGFVDTPHDRSPAKRARSSPPPDRVARDIIRAIDREQCVLYTPWFWRWIMLIINLIPEPIFRKLKL
ncbi:short-chain dehydrogenase/reductase SDR [Chthoniobacter flavus Ellin428]|uniref:Short-chain dehydrogenase/reductase SDR n=1 Tax=Chthoniobacter flavus Ellin428 TaxID=497964 RepID=B4D8N9_9BACT|nr:SDR family oxidoreductase [Chthoniobacter flavus]EDY17261.1 short-chain dehydrogenase/reductase SDR [Chthoniobacter flavus Ellin428]